MLNNQVLKCIKLAGELKKVELVIKEWNKKRILQFKNLDNN